MPLNLEEDYYICTAMKEQKEETIIMCTLSKLVIYDAVSCRRFFQKQQFFVLVEGCGVVLPLSISWFTFLWDVVKRPFQIDGRLCQGMWISLPTECVCSAPADQVLCPQKFGFLVRTTLSDQRFSIACCKDEPLHRCQSDSRSGRKSAMLRSLLRPRKGGRSHFP